MTVASSLARIDAWLRQNRPAYCAELRPGATAQEIDDVERELGLVLPDAVRALFAWRDGQAESCSASLVDNWMFSSLGSSLSSKRMLDDMIGYDFEDPGWWRREWVPLLANGGGDHLCVDLSDAGAGRLVTFRHDDADRFEDAPDVASWLRTLAASMEDGTYEVY